MYIDKNHAKAALLKCPPEHFTGWYKGIVNPLRNGLYLVKFHVTSKPEFSLFENGKWRILGINPHVVIYVNKDYVPYMTWQGLTEVGATIFTPLVL